MSLKLCFKLRQIVLIYLQGNCKNYILSALIICNHLKYYILFAVFYNLFNLFANNLHVEMIIARDPEKQLLE